MNWEKMQAAFDGAKLVRFDDGTQLIFVWNGAHTVNVYGPDLRPLDVMSRGDYAKDAATLEEIEESIREYLKELDEQESE